MDEKNELFDALLGQHKQMLDRDQFLATYRANMLRGWFFAISAMGIAYIWLLERAIDLAYVPAILNIAITLVVWMGDVRLRMDIFATRESGEKIELMFNGDLSKIKLSSCKYFLNLDKKSKTTICEWLQSSYKIDKWKKYVERFPGYRHGIDVMAILVIALTLIVWKTSPASTNVGVLAAATKRLDQLEKENAALRQVGSDLAVMKLYIKSEDDTLRTLYSDMTANLNRLQINADVIRDIQQQLKTIEIEVGKLRAGDKSQVPKSP